MTMETHAEDFQDAIVGKQAYDATVTIWSETRLTLAHLEKAGDVLQDALTAIVNVLDDDGAEVVVELTGPRTRRP